LLTDTANYSANLPSLEHVWYFIHAGLLRYAL